MTVSRFLDTNVIVYAVDATPRAARKREIARALLREGNFGVSAQVLQEFYVTVTRKLKRPLSVRTACRVVDQLCRAEVVAVDVSLVKTGIAHANRYQISYWDGAIIAAAEALGARVVLSEDLNHGQTYGSVRVANPFV